MSIHVRKTLDLVKSIRVQDAVILVASFLKSTFDMPQEKE
jgi:hypothetical protein